MWGCCIFLLLKVEQYFAWTLNFYQLLKCTIGGFESVTDDCVHWQSQCATWQQQRLQMYEDWSQSITIQSFIKLSQYSCPTFFLCFHLSNSPNQKRTSGPWGTPGLQWQRLYCTHIHIHMLTHRMKKHPSIKINSISNLCVHQQQRPVTILILLDLWQLCRCSVMCVCVYVMTDWTQIRGGVTGHSLIEQQLVCDCCSAISLCLYT